MAGEEDIVEENPYESFFQSSDLPVIDLDNAEKTDVSPLPPADRVANVGSGVDLYFGPLETDIEVTPADVATFTGETAGAVYGGIRGAQLGGAAAGLGTAAVATVFPPAAAAIPYTVAAGEIVGGAIGSGLMQTTARQVLENLGIAERTSVVQKGDDLAENVMADLVLEPATRFIAGRVAGPAAQRLREWADGAVRGLQWEDAITNAFVKNREEFDKYVYQGIGGDSLNAVDAYTQFANEVLRPENWNTRHYRQHAGEVFKRADDLHKEALENTNNAITQVYDTIEKQIVEGKAATATEREALVNKIKSLRANAKKPKGVAKEAKPSAQPDISSVPTQASNEAREVAAERAAAKRIASTNDLTFSVEDLELEETFSRLSARSLQMRYELADRLVAETQGETREDILMRLSRTEKGATSITQVMRKEIDKIYNEKAPKTYSEFLTAKEARANALKEMDKINLEMNKYLLEGKGLPVSAKARNITERAQELKELHRQAELNYKLYDMLAQESQNKLKQIRLTGKEALDLRRSLDAISAIPQRASAWNLESRMAYEANLAMANQIRGKMAQRVAELDPELGEQLANLNTYYGMLKRVEPDVARMAQKTPAEILSAKSTIGFIRSFFLPANELGQFKLGMRMYGASGTLTAPVMKGVRNVAGAVAEPALLLRQYPGLASGLSYPISEMAEPVLGFNIDEEVAQFEANLLNLASGVPSAAVEGGSKVLKGKYVSEVLQGRGNNSINYAKTKNAENLQGSIPVSAPGEQVEQAGNPYAALFEEAVPEEEPEESPKVEMEDTGLGTKKRK